jgi:HEAT repeat protein
MTHLDPSLPPGFTKIVGARSGCGWTLCWDDQKAAAYTRESGWIGLSGTRGPVHLAHATPDGILILNRNSRAGFWRYGAKNWSWWEDTPDLSNMRTIRCVDQIVVFYSWGTPENQFRFFRADPRGLTPIGATTGDRYGDLVSASLDHDENIVLACTKGVYRRTQDSGEHPFEAVQECEIDVGFFTQLEPVPGPGHVYIPRTLETALRIDMMTGETTELGLAAIDGCTALWRSLIKDRLDRIPLILEALKFTPKPTDIGDPPVLELVLDNSHWATVTTPGGVIDIEVGHECPNCRRLNEINRSECTGCRSTLERLQSPEPLTESVANSKEVDILTWNLLVKPDQCRSKALELMLSGYVSSGEVLASAVARSLGIGACAELIERAGDLNLDSVFRGSLETAQRLFGTFGAEVAPLVRDALEDDNPGKQALACAAAAATADGRPLIWDDAHPIPKARIVSLSNSNQSLVRILAARACGVLEIESCQAALRNLLSDNENSVREEAAEALAALPSLDETTQDLLGEVGLFDPDDSVREAAIKAIGEKAHSQRAMDALVDALGDLDDSTRSTAAEKLAERSADLTIDQYHRVVDITSLILMAAKLADDSSDYTFGFDDLFKSILENLVDPAETVEDLTHLKEQPKRIAAEGTVLALFPPPGSDGMAPVTEDDIEEVKAVLDCLESTIRLEPRDCERLLESPGAPPTSELAMRISEVDPTFGSKLAVIALFARRDEPVRNSQSALTEYDMTGYRPLHVRLHQGGGVPNPIETCRSLVESESRKEGLPGIAASFCLAAAGDREAWSRLVDRVLRWDVKGAKVVLPALMETLDSSAEKIDFMERFIAADAIPVPVRRDFYDNWRIESGIELSLKQRRPLLLACASSPEVSESDRWYAASELADSGDLSALEAYWGSRGDPHNLDSDDFYRYSVDLARCGHTDCLGNVRGQWIERGDLDALQAFEAVGTEEDIPEIESALEKRAPEQRIRDTVAAIRKRLANA